MKQKAKGSSLKKRNTKWSSARWCFYLLVLPLVLLLVLPPMLGEWRLGVLTNGPGVGKVGSVDQASFKGMNFLEV